MNSPVSGRMCRMLLSVSLASAISGEAMAATLPPVFERVQALPLSPKESRVKLLEVGGQFYGTSQRGGTSDQGTLYKLATDGTLTILVNFSGTNGATPKGGLILGTDGALYGTTEAGGASGKGTVFRVTTGGTLTTLSTFTGTNGDGPIGGVVLGTDGNYYGTTKAGGASDKGTVFKISSAGALTSLASFDGTNGSTPAGRLVADAGGLFYGVCSFGGTSNKGSVYTVTTGGTITRLASFDGTNGEQPVSTLTPEGNGNFLGSTWGSFVNSGSLFRITPAGTLTKLVDMGATRPSGELTLLADGNYYGTAYSGGTSSAGSVFKLTPAGDLSTISSFTIANGAGPAGGITLGTDGQIYGVTSSGGRIPGGGNSLNGVFFRMSAGGTVTPLNTFYDSIGRTPLAGLTLAADGNFYGTASAGGGSAYGTIFRMTPQGTLSVVHHCLDLGAYPKASVTAGTSVNSAYLYATTTYGGPSAGGQSNGTVLKINPADDTVTVEQKLNVGFPVAVGAQSVGATANFNATTYAVTSVGGSGGLGAVIRSQGGIATPVAEFSSSTGNTPLGGLSWTGLSSILYGSTSAGGTGGKGTIFRLTGTVGSYTTVVNFDGANGSTPVGELFLQGSTIAPTSFGVTRAGGSADKGTVFKTTSNGTLTTLGTFTGANGSTPQAGLVLAGDGNFYGTTEKGGTYDLGTIYRVTPTGVLTTVFNFDGANGSYPWSRLVSGPGGYLYGTTSAGGLSPDGKSGGGGQIFRLRVYPEVVTGTANPVSFNSALVRGTAYPVDQGAAGSFEYGTDSTLATSASAPANFNGITGNDLYSVLSPLAPLTTYYYRPVITLADGVTKVRGDIQSFTTLVAPPAIAVDAGGQTDLTPDGPPLTVPNTATGQSRDFAITIRTSAPTSTLSGLSASIAQQSGAFSILQQPATSVTYGNTATLVVRFTPVVTGGATATIAILSDDEDHNPFILRLRAWGGTTFSPVVDPANPDPVEWDGFTAGGITLSGVLSGPPHRGTEYVILSNPGSAAVEGTFNGLPEGSLVTLTYAGNNYRFLISYEGGDGNDIVLSYWPETGIDPEDSPEAFLFAALDSDRDDKLTPFEWQSIYVKIPKKETIFTAIDSDKDGFLSYAEFTAGATNRTASRTITTAVNRTAVFLEVDTSVDNIVSRAEIAFMWKPGTAAKTIDAYWNRAKGATGMDFWEWLWAQTLPSFTTYDQASTLRAQRLAIAGQLDTDTSGTISFAEFSHLYKAGTKTTTIDTAWRAANATPRGTASPAEMTINAFVEAAKLPKLTVF